ncbi:Fc receptor-like protein 5 isoform X2 [Amia ocellicauda]|uniref:Fc receptor-like protein 5 isoform X2 n=1 Tax=Amia ocellicauda TaxID=2972642 RepID=UPI003463F517
MGAATLCAVLLLSAAISPGQTEAVTPNGSLEETRSVTQQGNQTALPHASLTVEPHWSPIYTGETVSLRCGLYGGYTDWQYHWYKDGKCIEDAQPAGHTVTGDTLSITAVSVSDGGQYQCEGQRADRPLSSQRSDPISLSVSVRPRAVLTLQPDWTPVFTGETVTLRCQVQGAGDTYWRYRWYRGETQVHQTDSSTRDEGRYTISSVSYYHSGDYTCEGVRSGNPSHSDRSSSVTLTVSGARPQPVLTVSPLGQIFKGDSVTLRCEVKGASAGWRYYWYRTGHLQPLSDSSSGAGGNFTISAVTGTHRGPYWCRAERGDAPYYTQYSGAVTLTVSELFSRPTLTVIPAGSVWEGETVTLQCDTEALRADTQLSYTFTRDTETLRAAAAQSQHSVPAVMRGDSGLYRCEAQAEATSVKRQSDAVRVTVSVRPWAVLTLEPDWTPVFTGETVTLHCQVQGSGDTDWRYRWYRGETQVHQTDSSTRDEVRYTISSVSYYHSGDYTCEGVRSGNPSHSDRSSPVSLTVSESVPQPVLTVSPPGQRYKGDSVTLHCEMKRDSPAGWRYYWYRESQSGSPVYKTDSSTGALRSSYTINPVSLSHFGQYWCRAGRGDAPYYTQYSGAVTLTVSERPQAVLTLQPDWTPVFTGETVTLRCQVQGSGDTDWRYRWYRGETQVYPTYLYTGDEGRYTISSDSYYHSGDYTCEGVRSGNPSHSDRSSPVTLTVSGARPQPVLTVSPLGQIFEGDSVTLRCEVKGASAGWRYYWYRAGQSRAGLDYVWYNARWVYLQPLSDSSSGAGGNFTISAVTGTHRGPYWCRAERGDAHYYTQYSGAVTLTVSELFSRLALTVIPAGSVWEGETVTLQCDTEALRADTQLSYTFTRDTETLRAAAAQSQHSVPAVMRGDSGLYQCEAQAEGTSVKRQSDAVRVTVSEGRPAATLTLEPPWTQLYPLEPVSLRCGLSGASKGWTYRWYRDGSPTALSQSDGHTVTGDRLSITAVSVSDGGKYQCEGMRGSQSFVSQRSDGLNLSISELLPRVNLTVDPPRVQQFIGSVVTLKCGGPGGSAGWTVKRYTKGQVEPSCSSHRGETTADGCFIRYTSESDSGVYWCQSGAERSSAVTLRVTGGHVILESPPQPVTEGDTLTLRCGLRGYRSDSAVFYKDGVELQPQTVRETTIASVSVTDQGSYSCKYSDWGESPESWVSVRELFSSVTLSVSPGGTVTEGQALNFSCEAVVNTQSAAPLTCSFLRDNRSLDNSSESGLLQSLSQPLSFMPQAAVFTLLISSPDRSHTGRYRCVVSSHTGVSRESGHVDVQVQESVLWGAVAAGAICVALLLLAVLLGTVLYCRRRGGSGAAGKRRVSAGQSQFSDPTHSTAGVELSTLPLRTDDSVYLNVPGRKNSKKQWKKNTGASSQPDILYSEIHLPGTDPDMPLRPSTVEVCYSAINVTRPAGQAGTADPNEVQYSELSLQTNHSQGKRIRRKMTPQTDTLYSEVEPHQSPADRAAAKPESLYARVQHS